MATQMTVDQKQTAINYQQFGNITGKRKPRIKQNGWDVSALCSLKSYNSSKEDYFICSLL